MDTLDDIIMIIIINITVVFILYVVVLVLVAAVATVVVVVVTKEITIIGCQYQLRSPTAMSSGILQEKRYI